MICYTPLWKTMAEQGATTYTLRFKHGMSHATVQRLQMDMPVSTHTHWINFVPFWTAGWKISLNTSLTKNKFPIPIIGNGESLFVICSP